MTRSRDHGDDAIGPDSVDDALRNDGFGLHALRTARRVKGTPIPLRKSGLVSMYDATPDWTPIYDRSDLDGFSIACGTSGNQFKNAPVAGYAMAELIAAVEAGHVVTVARQRRAPTPRRHTR